MSIPEIQSMAEMESDYIAELENRTRFGRVEGGFLSLFFDPNDHEAGDYQIALTRIDTAEKLAGWLAHLTAKKWVTVEHVKAVIRTAERAGAHIDHDA